MNSSSAFSNVLSAPAVQPVTNNTQSRNQSDNHSNVEFKKALDDVQAEQDAKPKEPLSKKTSKSDKASTSQSKDDVNSLDNKNDNATSNDSVSTTKKAKTSDDVSTEEKKSEIADADKNGKILADNSGQIASNIQPLATVDVTAQLAMLVGDVGTQEGKVDTDLSNGDELTGEGKINILSATSDASVLNSAIAKTITPGAESDKESISSSVVPKAQDILSAGVTSIAGVASSAEVMSSSELSVNVDAKSVNTDDTTSVTSLPVPDVNMIAQAMANDTVQATVSNNNLATAESDVLSADDAILMGSSDKAVNALGEKVKGSLLTADGDNDSTQLSTNTPSTFEKILQTMSIDDALKGKSKGDNLESLSRNLTASSVLSASDLPGSSSSTSSTVVDSLMRGVEAQSPAARSFVVQTSVPVTVGQPQWSQAVGEKVLWLAAQNVHSAEIRLDPPELGPMMVKISVNQEQTSINFTSHHAGVREVLDQNLNRLRDMFTEQGLNLVNVDVSDKSFQRQQGNGDERKGQADNADQIDEETPIAMSAIVQKRLVDHYA